MSYCALWDLGALHRTIVLDTGATPPNGIYWTIQPWYSRRGCSVARKTRLTRTISLGTRTISITMSFVSHFDDISRWDANACQMIQKLMSMLPYHYSWLAADTKTRK